MTKTDEFKRLLVVDDEADIGFLMKVLLSPEGFTVDFAQNMAEAKKVLSQHLYHTVFLDLNLENEFGLDLIPTIRATNDQAQIAVITAQKEEAVLKKVEESEVEHLIAKPFNRDRVLEVLKNPQ